MFGSTGATFSSIIDSFVGNIVTPLTWLLSGIAMVVFLFGLVRYVMHGADSKAHQEAIQLIIWGLLGLFVIFSLGAILALMCTTLLGAGNCKA